MFVNCTLKPLKLVRFGEILFDQQKRLILLCGSCHRHYLSLESFQKHLNECIAGKHIVSSTANLQYDNEQMESKLVNGKQVLHIYEPSSVRAENNNYNYDWEVDIKNSRWCMEDIQIMSIEPKQPLYATIADDKPSIEQSSKSVFNGMLNADNRATLINTRDKLGENSNIFAVPNKLKNKRYLMQNIAEEFWRLDAVNPSNSMPTSNPSTDGEDGVNPSNSMPTSNQSTDGEDGVNPSNSMATSNPSTDGEAVTSIPPTDGSKRDTQETLKKLRACGVIVKRRNTLGPLDGPALEDAKRKLALQMKNKN